MAHFLEHLVFKGGQKYDDYRKVNQTAETMGAVLNAYTSHDLVAFHITCRAEVAARGDRPADRLRRAPEDRRRGARPRARRRDPGDRARATTSRRCGRAPDRPRGVRRPPARAARCSGPEEHLRTFSRDAILAFRRRQWVGARGGAFLVGNLDHLPENSEMAELFGRFPSISSNGGVRAGAAVRADDAGRGSASPTSRTCGCPTGPSIDPRAPRERAALAVYSTLLGGSMGSRLFDEIREQRGLAYSVYAVDHAFADVPILQLSAGLDSDEVRRGLHAHARDRRRAARPTGPTRGGGRARARLRRRPARAGVREHQRRRAPRGRRRPSSSARTSTPTRRSRRSTRSPTTRSCEVARGISEELSVACVGPHDAASSPEGFPSARPSH